MKVDYIQHCGTDLTVVNAARVSFDKESEWNKQPPQFEGVKVLSQKDCKLIRYLAKHKHKSPFNHTFITLRVKAPIFVARQLVKHEYMPWNEVSRRYVTDNLEMYYPGAWRLKAEDKKQGSSEEVIFFKSEQQSKIVRSVEDAVNLYHELLDKGICPEQARMVLPQSMYTEWYWSGTLYAYAKMMKLRLAPDTQYETRLIAEQCRSIIEPLFPVSLPALLDGDFD